MTNIVYARVSTTEQTTDNQLHEIQAAGFEVDPDFVFVDDGISGSAHTSQRPAFARMESLLRAGDRLIVTKLDRIGRDAIDVQETIRRLAAKGVAVHVLALGGTDLTTSAGKLMLTMLAAVAEMERDLIRERTQAGLERAKSEGKRLGRPSMTPEQIEAIRSARAAGESVRNIAKRLSISTSTVQQYARPACPAH
ncbi:recombinase family protein [Laribacter hongkongensis]|uniref:recombinase family protein n=1 Tax=Laribacter hongkongensis TaxID=168471 RepID=UPI001EFC51CE|nr:recombinase family protein [Laribacter hongkongensis]MCG8991742.1 recombinase family protein [Laribacter hongkongensis]MCG8998920.1 recombinase family protein [Laribacter hongkongensis]MCG9000280.1 recombinase family protein [Laribacter hongkongensis]MCG9004824.1 recombinase family protein [Laribacter hongkongensis]MCG9006670.1 recombinase family protein [Laribacter hongkongensis]